MGGSLSLGSLYAPTVKPKALILWLSKRELGQISHDNSTLRWEGGSKKDFYVLPTSEPLGREEKSKGSEEIKIHQKKKKNTSLR